MRTLPPPMVDAAELLSTCIGGLKDSAAVSRLNAASAAMLAGAAAFDANAVSATLHTIPRVSAIGPASATDMIGLYKDQMVALRGPARAHYDLIKAGSPHSRCPLCGVGIVRTLDHHLPKSKYPNLAVCPRNLVPACDWCQTGKLAKHPANAGEQTLHPYYDDFNSEQWIFGTLDRMAEPVVLFQVVAPAAWPAVARERVWRHFDVLKLAKLYTSNANDDIGTLRDRLIRLGTLGGPAAVFADLDDERERWKSRLNSWQHVTYQTLAGNPWFVNGGYLNIPT